MKKVITLFAAVVMIASFSNTVLADGGATATATSSATIVAPITIVKATDMNFGNVAVNSAVGGGTVVLIPAGTRTTTGTVTLPTTAGTVSAASFTIGGTGTYSYIITLPTTCTLTSGANTMTVGTFTSTPSATGALTAGAQTLLVGATLTVAASQATGVYVSGTAFNVTVNYN